MLFAHTPELPAVEFKIAKPAELQLHDQKKIIDLRRISLGIDFPKRSDSQVEYLVEKTRQAAFDPNKGVDGSLLRRGQSYARTAHIMAFHQGQLLAHLPTADNASSTRKPAIVNLAERQVKLHLENFKLKDEPAIKRRWAWLGLCAISPVGRKMIQDAPPEDANLLDVMIGIAATKADPRQPMSAWPWTLEHRWTTGLLRAGFKVIMQGDELETLVPAFGPHNQPVGQMRFVADRAGDVTDKLITIDPQIGNMAADVLYGPSI